MVKEGCIEYSELVGHYCRVNGCTREDFERDRKEAFELWWERSQSKWTLDLSYLERYVFRKVRGITTLLTLKESLF